MKKDLFGNFERKCRKKRDLHLARILTHKNNLNLKYKSSADILGIFETKQDMREQIL
jgi:hypothetical protein